MGQLLSSPITTKRSSDGGDDRIIFGASAMQGWRVTMEDSHTTILSLRDAVSSFDPKSLLDLYPKPQTEEEAEIIVHNDSGSGLESDPGPIISFFAVFDGHRGDTVANAAGKFLHRYIFEDPSFADQNYETAIKRGFARMDSEILTNEAVSPYHGCTAIAILIDHQNEMIYAGNAGDSRAVLSRAGKAVPLSFDHKPDNHEEKIRILSAGGFVVRNRVNGTLALSRAFGDFDFKVAQDLPMEKQMVTADPDICKLKITAEDEFIIVACDGIWDCYTNQQAVDFVRGRISLGESLTTACEKLMDNALATDVNNKTGRGCDNMTAIIVGILPQTLSEDFNPFLADETQISDIKILHSSTLESTYSNDLHNYKKLAWYRLLEKPPKTESEDSTKSTLEARTQLSVSSLSVDTHAKLDDQSFTTPTVSIYSPEECHSEDTNLESPSNVNQQAVEEVAVEHDK